MTIKLVGIEIMFQFSRRTINAKQFRTTQMNQISTEPICHDSFYVNNFDWNEEKFDFVFIFMKFEKR